MSTVQRLGSEHPVVIFSRSTCPISHAIRQMIGNFGAYPAVYELDQLPNGQELERELQELGCNPSIPSVFIGKKLVGGGNEIISLKLRGQLRTLLLEANAIWV